MWPELLIPAGIGAVTSGLEAARQGKGPLDILGSSLIGGGLGLGLGKLGRFAGEAVSNLGGVVPATVEDIGTGLVTQAQAAARSNIGTAGAKAVRDLSAAGKFTKLGIEGLGHLAIPGIASGLSSAVTAPVRFAGDVASAAVGGGGNLLQPPVKAQQFGALPANAAQWGPYGPVGPAVKSPLDIAKWGPFQAGLLAERMTGTVAAENLQKLENVEMGAREQAARNDMAREVYAKSYLSNLGNQQQMLLNSQQSAQEMGRQATVSLGGIIGRQYTYA